MGVAELPSADEQTLRRLLTRGEWVMLAVYDHDEGPAVLDALVPEDDDLVAEYEWLQVDASTDAGDALLTGRGIVPGTRFVILSPYQDGVGTWVLDDLDEREPEDLVVFMEDHASDVELDAFEYDVDDEV